MPVESDPIEHGMLRICRIEKRVLHSAAIAQNKGKCRAGSGANVNVVLPEERGQLSSQLNA